ncbi:hypothetical protein BSK63_30840, partial [Paenibacillus odorifer]
ALDQRSTSARPALDQRSTSARPALDQLSTNTRLVYTNARPASTNTLQMLTDSAAAICPFIAIWAEFRTPAPLLPKI